MAPRAKGSRVMHPALLQAIEDEKKLILDMLADPNNHKGCTIKDFQREIKKQMGYNTTTVKDRVNALADDNKLHRSAYKGKGGAYLYVLGPRPVGQQAEVAPSGKVEEPPLASDELLSFMHHIENQMSAKLLALEKKMISIDGLARRNADALARALILLTQACDELGVGTKAVLDPPAGGDNSR